jgi:hypothetical protein
MRNYEVCVLASFVVKNPTFCPQTAFTCFVRFRQQTEINFHAQNFITETNCVYRVVRTECLSLNLIQMKFSPHIVKSEQ